MTQSLDHQYIAVLKDLINKSESNPEIRDRTGVGTFKSFGNIITIDISNSFPMLLSRQVPIKSMITEFLFFLNGYTNNGWLIERGCKFWDEFKHPETGELGPVYGAQLRNFNNQGYDQLVNLIEGLKTRPNSRRHMFTYFNPLVMPDETKSHKQNIEEGRAVLPPCHLFYQFNVEDGNLDGLLYQRSADWCIGTPINIAQTALWVYFLSTLCGYKPRNLVYMTGDTHVYSSHIEEGKKLIECCGSISEFIYPQMKVSPDICKKKIEDITFEDFELIGYNPVYKANFKIAV